MRHQAAMVATGVLLALAPAWAGSVYLNGVKIDGVTNQKFEKATVRIDEKGDVHIDAPGYQVRAVEGGPAPQSAPSNVAPTRRYFLVLEQTPPGMTEYDVDVYINSKWVKTVKSDEEPVLAEDVTKHVSQGKNTVLFMAKKKLQGPSRKSFSPEHQLKLMIGEGNAGGNKVMIDATLVKFQRTAADTESVSQEFTFQGR